ncbi:MAG: hypothetical protein KC503_19015 [Myxococcales bacterium]|nr:hypothetical protein [Myxococcales bacterium]
MSNADTRAALKRAGIDPDAIHCNNAVFWFPNLWAYSKLAAKRIAKLYGDSASTNQQREGAKVVLGYLVRTVYQELAPHNFGVMPIKGRTYTDKAGKRHPLLLFRSGVTFHSAEARSCLRTLLGAGHVRHVVNLYDGTFPLGDLIEREARIAHEAGATHHDERTVRSQWRALIKRPEGYTKHHDAAMKQVARIINEQVLAPGGKAPRGNIRIHCGGGMHRTGMVFGVIQRCINKASPREVQSTYRRHTAYSTTKPTGYEKLNERFIREFDCSLLRGASKQAK